LVNTAELGSFSRIVQEMPVLLSGSREPLALGGLVADDHDSPGHHVVAMNSLDREASTTK
jgi:hypothetical protein